MSVGRFAPSPTGALHVGSLRTALGAWVWARATGSRFIVRMEDLDRHTSSPEHAAGQLRDLERLGLDWDGPVVFQSARFDRYEEAIESLSNRTLTYECFCTRREIAEAASAPHAMVSAAGDAGQNIYPGTCRLLTTAQRAERVRTGRPPALRLRTDRQSVAFFDEVHGQVEGLVDDVVLRRNDGTPAYNLAVIVDDDDQGVEHVVRGDDLLSSTPRQIHLGRLLSHRPNTYAHLPLVLSPSGDRLAKRHGSVTLEDLTSARWSVRQLVGALAHSLGWTQTAEPLSADELLAHCCEVVASAGSVPGRRSGLGQLTTIEPWVFTPPPTTPPDQVDRGPRRAGHEVGHESGSKVPPERQ